MVRFVVPTTRLQEPCHDSDYTKLVLDRILKMNRVNTNGVFSNSEMFDPYEWPRWTWSIYMGQRSWGMSLDKYRWNHKFETVWVPLASVCTRRQTFGGFFKMFMLYCIYWLNTQYGCSANSAMSWLVESTWLKTMGYPKNRYYNGEKEQHLTKISNHPSIQDDVGSSHKVPGRPHPWQCQIQHTTSRLETFEEAHWEILGGLWGLTLAILWNVFNCYRNSCR